MASTSATGGAAPLDGEEILDLTPIDDAALNSNESCSRESATTGGRSHTQINHFCDVGKPPPKSMVEPILPAAVKELTRCDELKSAANDLFKDKKYSKAMEKYGEALAHPSCTEDNSNTLLVNRAMASLRLAEESGVAPADRQSALESALADARAASTADAKRAKAHFREAQACMLLGRKAEARLALHRMWSLEPGNKEAHKLLSQCDEGYSEFLYQLDRMAEATEKKREKLSQMVHRSHPRSLRLRYYKTWMVHWQPSDRETTLAEAFMKVVQSLTETVKKEARELAILAKEKGDVSFGDDGLGVFRYMQARNDEIHAEAFDLTGIVMEELSSERAYMEPALFCATVERVSEGREDEYPHLTDELRDRIGALRPVHLMGTQCKAHPLKAWMTREMGLQMRKDILISVCIHTVMVAAGVLNMQRRAKTELRNMRRAARGLRELAPGEESEDDEILNKTDLEEYQERTPVTAGEALQFAKSGQLSSQNSRA